MDKEKRTQSDIASGWLPITIQSLHEAMDAKGIKSTRRNLYNSIAGNLLRGADGDISTIIIRFAFYGRFVDMGVGRGVPIGGRKEIGTDYFLNRNEKGQLNIYRRKAKKWYSPTVTREQGRLQTLLLQHLNISTINIIERGLTDEGVDINL